MSRGRGALAYAGDRVVVDADSHLMEWPTFLSEQADPGVRAALPVLGGGFTGLEILEREHGAAERAALAALGDDLIRRGPKWHAALGAADPVERAQALDLLG